MKNEVVEAHIKSLLENSLFAQNKQYLAVHQGITTPLPNQVLTGFPNHKEFKDLLIKPSGVLFNTKAL